MKIFFFLFLFSLAQFSYAQQCGPGLGSCPAPNCCSRYGWCGTSAAYCGTGCQLSYGICAAGNPTSTTTSSTTSTSTSSSPSPTSTSRPVSTNGQCQTNGAVCPSGQCCSQYGWCGTSAAYCGSGCQLSYGICAAGNPTSSPTSSTSSTSTSSTSSATSSSPSPTSTTRPVSTNGQCQTNGSMCPSGQCCSQYGWCGTTAAYCGSGCQMSWGICSGTAPPSTTTTSTTTQPSPTSTPPPATGNIRIVTQCTVPGTVAITFDDGPYLYTSDIVRQFNAAGGKVTFFMNGLNYGCIYNQAAAVKEAFNSGHQIGSHTWSHKDLALLSSDQVSTEMSRLSTAFRKIIGADPVYMRPPYGSYTQSTATTLQNLGYKVLAMWSIDSGDSAGLSPAQQQQRYNSASSSILHNILQHETLQSTAQTMVPFIINWARQRNLRMVTLGTCLGDAESNWYRNRITPESNNPSWVC